MEDEYEATIDGSFEYGDEEGYVKESGTVGVESDSAVHIHLKADERDEGIHARATLTPEVARAVGERLIEHADRIEE
ncbi:MULTISPECIES: hypothetical protein [Halorussus]|uniref:hypothetical protein n=1 Tax=Halorussus TaxID=1070314 RepID=UPI0020A22EE5|nr:hypothetical protein [Halorussus vallis]USZ73836.1 hypothetical protein NGM07_10225 [Halorussus vallis]